MNLELIARLNQDHLAELHRDAAKGGAARQALRLPRAGSGPTLVNRIRSLFTPAVVVCCPALS